MIFTRDLQKSYGSRAVLRGLDLVAEPGAITLVVGANAAGKSTTLRLLAGLAEPDSGTIGIGGFDLRTQRREALSQISFLPQAPRFHPRLTVGQVATFYAELRGREAKRVPTALEAWGIAEFARTPTAKLSGGLRQRLALAVFALAEAPVLLLDEPGLSLDPEWRQRLQDFLTGEAKRGRTVVVATHLLGEWEGRADRCLLIEEGRCAGELAPERLRDGFFGGVGHVRAAAERCERNVLPGATVSEERIQRRGAAAEARALSVGPVVVES
ncbi:ABC transporter ATP-binding protein [Opitutaceae bacterium EW11]|nr:ABC transporter ATP-binding protein [Opitutaceae bacterium EW11]